MNRIVVFVEMQNAAHRSGMTFAKPTRVMEFKFETVGDVYAQMKKNLPDAQVSYKRVIV